jgi:hypothetical protein
MSPCFSRSAVSLVTSLVASLACTLVPPAYAATPITVTSQAAPDGPIRYTVKVTSKQFGNAQETRTIRSGESDDFTWKTVPPGGPVAAVDQCPADASLPVDTNGRRRRYRHGPAQLPGADPARHQGSDEQGQDAPVSERPDGQSDRALYDAHERQHEDADLERRHPPGGVGEALSGRRAAPCVAD